KIVVKRNAPELLRKELSKKSWQGEVIAFSGITDCYQPLEATYELTRRCLTVCLEFQNPVSIVTKGALIRRDVELIAELSRRAGAHVSMSVAFADDDVARKIEPYANRPSNRFEAMRRLSDAGISTGILIAPVIPGLNDTDVPVLLSRARAAGATRAGITLLRLPSEVLPVFQERIEEAFPERAKRINNAILEVRGGKMNESAFGSRMTGQGARWEAVQSLFDVHCRKLGLNRDQERGEGVSKNAFRRPTAQGRLFDL
ncbi:MAG: radical SAM protein, partial [Byssovorax sp.]